MNESERRPGLEPMHEVQQPEKNPDKVGYSVEEKPVGSFDGSDPAGNTGKVGYAAEAAVAPEGSDPSGGQVKVGYGAEIKEK